jgi:hypothetical protein
MFRQKFEFPPLMTKIIDRLMGGRKEIEINDPMLEFLMLPLVYILVTIDQCYKWYKWVTREG